MLKSYNTCIKEYGNQYQMQKAITDGKLYKFEEGIYSDSRNTPEVAIITAKYPNAIIAGEYAFYYYGFTDVVPDKYNMATKSKAAKIIDDRVFQIYVPEEIFDLGATVMDIDGYKIRIYDKERMLIELLRNKNSMPYDLYKEILLKYRTIINSLQIWRIQEYASVFPKSKMIRRALDLEVM